MNIPDMPVPFSVRQCPGGDRGPAIERKFDGQPSYGIWHGGRREWTLSAVWTLGQANDHLDLLTTGWHQALADLRAGIGVR